MDNKDDIAQKRKDSGLSKKVNQRITIAKHGREAFHEKNYVQAAKNYNEYLMIVSEMKGVSDIYKITPKMFHEKNDLTEMLLISHIFWELARINEMTPKLTVQFQNCLDQFTRFTINQPYQVLNAEMLRKFIAKNKNVSTKLPALNKAYQQIFTDSKKCFISTYAYGSNHEITMTLRELKDLIVKYPLGLSFTRAYYIFSPEVIRFCENRVVFKKFLIFTSRPILFIIAKIFKKVFKI